MKSSRRQFLQVSAALAAAGCTNPSGSDAGDASGQDAVNTDAQNTDAQSTDVTMDTAVGDATSEAGDVAPGDGGVVDTEFLIIGTGFGGAITALRLAQAGHRVVMLERGKRWPLTAAYNTFARLVLPDRRAAWMSRETVLPFGPVFPLPGPYVGVLERVRANGINVYTGAGVGGGSLVYGGYAVKPSAANFDRVAPPGLRFSDLESTYYDRALSAFRASTLPADLLALDYWRSERVFLDHAARAGVATRQVLTATDWNVVRAELNGTVPESALQGEVIYGNNNGCKWSLDRTTLKDAEDTGLVTIETQHQVRELAQNGNSGYRVVVDVIDTGGNVTAVKVFTCRKLFLCAGAYHSTRLLVRAKAKGALPQLNDQIGRNWGNNGNSMFLRSGVADSTGDRQASFGGTAIDDTDNPISPLLVEHAQMPTLQECNCLNHLSMAVDVGSGSFRYDTATDSALLDWPANGDNTSRMAAQHLADRLTTAAGGRIDGSIEPMIMVPGILTGFTYHPLGGAVLGQGTDMFGRVTGHPGLYVLDGSLLQRSAGAANPAFTIAALVERCIENIVANDLT